MYENATIPTTDWLQNEAGIINTWDSQYTKVKLNDYYRITCNNVRKVFYLRPTNAQIEEFIQTGKYTHTDTLGNIRTIASCITSLEERAYIFKMAQAKQLLYDISKGRAAVLEGSSTIADDSADCLKELGLYQRTEFTI